MPFYFATQQTVRQESATMYESSLPTQNARPFAPLQKGNERAYERIFNALALEIETGRFGIGDRLPAERDLRIKYNVSRPVVREAMIALEVKGLVEVRVGSGAYVRAVPVSNSPYNYVINSFELTEARLYFEGEATALAAIHITRAEVAGLNRLLDAMSDGNDPTNSSHEADRAFHLTIAKATRNTAMLAAIESFWRVRSISPECGLLQRNARSEELRPEIEEHRAIVTALANGDAVSSRRAMRTHLSAVMDRLLITAEFEAVEQARQSLALVRERFTLP
jgi:DNA-binding FadR family transcriptional regulator